MFHFFLIKKKNFRLKKLQHGSRDLNLPSITVPSGSPQNLTITSLSPTSLHLQWALPPRKHRQGTIQLHQLVYCLQENPTRDYITNTSALSLTLTDLQPDTPYTFLLRAFTSAGPGQWTPRLVHRTPPLGWRVLRHFKVALGIFLLFCGIFLVFCSIFKAILWYFYGVLWYF